MLSRRQESDAWEQVLRDSWPKRDRPAYRAAVIYSIKRLRRLNVQLRIYG